MADRRQKNATWFVTDEFGHLYASMKDGAILATLMDIRDELQRLNTLLHCSNAVNIPTILRSIRRNTAKPRKKRKP